MKKKLNILIISTLLLSACGGGSSEDPVVTVPVKPPVTNTAPIAVTDSALAQNNVSATIDVLANDTDAENSTLSIDAITVAPTHGTSEVVNNTIVYTPAVDYIGSDTLTYQITDGELTAQASVTITVNHTVTLIGLVTDAPLANATVTVDLNETTFTTSTNDLGQYRLPITINTVDTPVIVHAKGSASQANVELIKLIGSTQSLLSLMDEERNLSAGAKNLTNITQLSTATYLLAKDRNNNQAFSSDYDYQLEKYELSGENIINTAGFIKLLVDNPNFLIPQQQSLLSLLDPINEDISTVAAITRYLKNNNHIDEYGQTTPSYNDALALAITETLSDTNVIIPFTTQMLANNVFINKLYETQKGWLRSKAPGFQFNADGTLMTYENTSFLDSSGVLVKTNSWQVTEGQLVITAEAELTNLSVSYPYYELIDTYGFDASVVETLINAANVGAIGESLLIRATYGFKNQKGTILSENTASMQVSYTGEFIWELDLKHLGQQYGVNIWPEANPKATSIKSYQETYTKANTELFSDKTLADIAGKWVMPFDHVLGNHYFVGREVKGLFLDTIQITTTTAVSSKSGHQFTPTLENGVLTLVQDDLTYKITPFKQLGKGYLAQIEKWQNNTLVYVLAENIAQFDDSYTLLTDSLVTELPMAQLAYNNALGTDAWVNNKLSLNHVFGYHFKSDGTLNRGINARTDENGNSKFVGDDSWTWSVSENLIHLNLSNDDTRRTWQVISVDDDNRALVIESATQSRDLNSDNELSDDEKELLRSPPRINIIKKADLSQWPEAWGNTQL